MFRIRIFATVGIALLAVALTACGGDDYDGAAGPTAAATGSTVQTSSGPVVKVGNDAKFGSILTTIDGFTLYTFNQDSAGKSTCTAACAATWPALTTTNSSLGAVVGAPGEFSLLARDDGSKQVAFNGKPLYRYAPDKPGDTSGNGVGNVWFVAKATGSTSSGTPSASPSASTDAGPVVY